MVSGTVALLRARTEHDELSPHMVDQTVLEPPARSCRYMTYRERVYEYDM